MATTSERAHSIFRAFFPKEYKVKVGPYSIGHRFPCFFIAEIGINHNGSIEIAKKLIDAAADAGCQAVKFQKRTVPVVYSAEELAKPRAVDRSVLEEAVKRGVLSPEAVERLKRSDFKDSTNGDLKWALEFTEAEYRDLFAYARSKGLVPLASPWDVESVDFLEKLDVSCYKIASASITDEELLRRVRSKGKPVFMSTGMSTMAQVLKAIEIFGQRELIILHTVSTYPAEDKDLNLSVIRTLHQAFPKVPIGYSGHERGITPSVSAVVLGASVVERHITLDKHMFGSDQSASLEPQELAELVRQVRGWESSRGTGIKGVAEVEIPVMQKLRKK